MVNCRECVHAKPVEENMLWCEKGMFEKFPYKPIKECPYFERKELVVNILGNFTIPREHRNRKVLSVKQRWVTEVRRGRSIQMFFRHKSVNQKPYLPEGFVEINKQRYRMIHPDWKLLLSSIG